jgi:hypothetical protein
VQGPAWLPHSTFLAWFLPAEARDVQKPNIIGSQQTMVQWDDKARICMTAIIHVENDY